MSSSDKLRKLEKIIRKSQSAVIAFSGGLDSSFLLYAAAKILPKDKILAVTADSKTYPRQELKEAKKIAAYFKVRHKIIKTKELNDVKFSVNSVNRCYFCKKHLFSDLKKEARENKLSAVFDASNTSDKMDFRPGSRAKNELGVRSPLQEAGISKKEIIELSRRFNLPTQDKPSQACLASRLPYGSPIKPVVLRRIEKSESFMRKAGFRTVRLRDYGSLCRIEVGIKDFPKVLLKRSLIVDKLRQLGYNYITLDLKGFRSGSMNEVIKR